MQLNPVTHILQNLLDYYLKAQNARKNLHLIIMGNNAIKTLIHLINTVIQFESVKHDDIITLLLYCDPVIFTSGQQIMLGSVTQVSFSIET